MISTLKAKLIFIHEDRLIVGLATNLKLIVVVDVVYDRLTNKHNGIHDD